MFFIKKPKFSTFFFTEIPWQCHFATFYGKLDIFGDIYIFLVQINVLWNKIFSAIIDKFQVRSTFCPYRNAWRSSFGEFSCIITVCVSGLASTQVLKKHKNIWYYRFKIERFGTATPMVSYFVPTASKIAALLNYRRYEPTSLFF